MSDLAERLAGLSAKKCALLIRRLTADRAGAAQTLTRRPRVTSSFPLSFGQQRLWFLDQLMPGTAAYNVRAALRLKGPLNFPALEQALNEIVSRHESLRTVFATEDGHPVQIIRAAFTLVPPFVDFEGNPAATREAEVTRLAVGEARQPFHLAKGPLLRTTLLRLKRDDHVLLLTTHHIISDGWSMSVFMEEVALLYDANANGRPSPLRELPIQYVDYACWQRESLQGDLLSVHLAYWKKHLGGSLPAVTVPPDRPRPAIQTFRGAKQRLVIEKDLTESLKGLSRREGVTLFITVTAAFNVLLHRYTGKTDTIVGTPIANRNRSEIEVLIGFFANTLVLRTDLSGDPSFRELLARLRTVATSAYDHQDLPFDKLVEELHPERSLNQTPLFQVMLQLSHSEIENVALGGLTFTHLDIDSGVSKFDMSLSLTEKEASLTGLLEYNTDLFDASTISRVLSHYRALLEGAAASPNEVLSLLPLLTEAEKHQSLVGWNDTRRDYFTAGLCIHTLFEAQAERTPHSVAVVYEDEQLSYRELNARANQLARHLRSLGVSPNALVGVFIERSVELIVAVLGVLKSGGAYVPLYPEFPRQRLAMVTEDTRLEVALTEQSLVGSIAKYVRHAVCLNSDWNVISQESCDDPAVRVTADMVAYVIYTSGSTGNAKGVLVEHRQVTNYIFAIIERLGLAPDASFAMIQPLTVDACKTALYPPLLTGGSVHLVSTERAGNPRGLGEFCKSHQIACLKIAPSHLSALVARGDSAGIMPRESLVIGGETCHWDFINKLGTSAPHCAIVNQYGPTETTVGMLTYRIESDKRQRCVSVPIGRPIANSQVYLLDARLQPVPVGANGGVHIGGDCVARGYLNRPDLTAEKFLPDPFSTMPGARLYSSGDLARHLADGDIEFLGRADNQVKVRGFRIELGEVEAVLSQHPRVRAATVIAAQDGSDGKKLIAYIVPSHKQEPPISELRYFLRERLPGYMIPASFVSLESMPLTSHGKVDFAALPLAAKVKAEPELRIVEPYSELEKAIASIWREALKVDRVGLHDNFFDIGGHSLLIIQVKERLLDVLQKDVPVIDLFRYPTIGALAKYLGQAETQKPEFRQVQDRASRQQAAISRQVEFIKGREKER